MTSPTPSDPLPWATHGGLHLATYATLAAAWMAWAGPGPGGWPFVGQPWWQWPFEVGFLALSWFMWTLMVGCVLQGIWLLGQALVLACILLLSHRETALRGFSGRVRP